jgi:hypothetical protein
VYTKYVHNNYVCTMYVVQYVATRKRRGGE